MKHVILAAGYGTRLKGVTSLPKGLIKDAAGNEIIKPLLTKIASLYPIENIILITNAVYEKQYREWMNNHNLSNLLIENDGSVSAETRLGAIGDLLLGIKRQHLVNHDVAVYPSDTMFDFDLQDFINAGQQHPYAVTTVFRRFTKPEIANRLGCARIERGKVVDFVEKPSNPPDVWGAIPFYYYPSKLLSIIETYAADPHNSKDAPGSIIPWMIRNNIPVRAFCIESITKDVGTPEDLNHLSLA